MLNKIIRNLCLPFQLSEDGARVLDLSTFGSATDFSRPYHYRHHQVLLHLHVGSRRLWMR